MWCLTRDDSQLWTQQRGLLLDEAGLPVLTDMKFCISAPLPQMGWSKLNAFAGYLSWQLEPFEECLLWVTQWGLWPSSENWQLFYQLRESYGERRMLQNAPGHLFLKHEKMDLSTFVQLVLLAGWDCFLLPSPAGNAIFISHDEFLQFYTNDAGVAEAARESLQGTVMAGEPSPESAA